MPIEIRIRVKNFFSRYLSPTRIFVLSFAAVILAGGILLCFPFSASKEPLRFVDALFSSTSAVCVTGLVVIDIGKDLRPMGSGDHDLPFSNRWAGYHHLLHGFLCLNGSRNFFQGKGDCSIDLSPHASNGFHRDCQDGPLVYVRHGSPRNLLSLHPVFHGFSHRDSPLSCRL